MGSPRPPAGRAIAAACLLAASVLLLGGAVPGGTSPRLPDVLPGPATNPPAPPMDPPIRVLIASAVPHAERRAFVAQMASYRGTAVRFALNSFEGPAAAKALEIAVHEARVEELVAGTYELPVGKPAFWKAAVTPQLASSFDFVWCLDADMAFGRDNFNLSAMLASALLSRAPLSQPSIARHPAAERQQTPFQHLWADERRTATWEVGPAFIVEVMAPLFTAGFWAHCHRTVLSPVPEAALASARKMDHVFCSAAADYLDRTVLEREPLPRAAAFPVRSRRVPNPEFVAALAANATGGPMGLNTDVPRKTLPSYVENHNVALDRPVDPCAVLHAAPIVHTDTRSFDKLRPGGAEKSTNYWAAAAAPGHRAAHALRLARSGGPAPAPANTTTHPAAFRAALVLAQSNPADLPQREVIEQAARRNPPRLPPAEQQAFAARAAEIYDRHRLQTPASIAALRAKWSSRLALGPDVDPWDAFLALKNVTDDSDNSLMGLSGYVHGLQVFEAMQKDGVTDPRLLFLALYHDVGKVALLDGEDPANVVCTNDALFVDGRPASRETLASLAGRGLAAIETQFGHDDVAHLRLAPHLPPEVSYVLRYHSFSPLLNGDLDHVLTAEERAGQDLLLRFWAYDHRHKSAANAEPDVDLGEAEMVVRAFLPRRIAI